MNDAGARIGVYLHWPFCARICPYCDFNVYKSRDIDAARWRQALVRDLGSWAQRTGKRPLASLYFGGGTPSLAPVAVIAGVIDACADLWGFAPDAEITLEANPTDAEKDRFQSLAAVGVNRLSLGVQSFDDAELRFLGRNHDGAAARRALDAALAAFARTSFDLIYGLPDQTPADWGAALRNALAFGAPHLSLYQLTIEEGTAFERAVTRGAWAPPTDDVAADLFDVAQEETARAGLRAYEISNHAAPGGESRHNLLYWTGADYVGVGPGAHGRITEGGRRVATETALAPEDYLKAVEATGCGAVLVETLTPAETLTERLAMGLRLRDGIALSGDDLAALADRLPALEADGLLLRDGARLAATAAGRRLLNSVLAAIFA